jgi:hypothetical protein
VVAFVQTAEVEEDGRSGGTRVDVADDDGAARFTGAGPIAVPAGDIGLVERRYFDGSVGRQAC